MLWKDKSIQNWKWVILSCQLHVMADNGIVEIIRYSSLFNALFHMVRMFLSWAQL